MKLRLLGTSLSLMSILYGVWCLSASFKEDRVASYVSLFCIGIGGMRCRICSLEMLMFPLSIKGHHCKL